MALHLPHIRAVVFDWAGTIVDHGSCAPVKAFLEVFKRNGVTVDVVGTYNQRAQGRYLAASYSRSFPLNPIDGGL